MDNTNYRRLFFKNTSDTTDSQSRSLNPIIESYGVLDEQQAVVIESAFESGLSIQDYAYAIADLIDPNTMIAIAPFYTDTICMYLKDKEIADELVFHHKSVQIKGINVVFYRKVELLDVDPIIPNSLIEHIVDGRNELRRGSKVMYKKIESSEDVANIRYFHAHPDTIAKSARCIEIPYVMKDRTVTFAPVRFDQPTCSICKESGTHVTKFCTKNSNVHASMPAKEENRESVHTGGLSNVKRVIDSNAGPSVRSVKFEKSFDANKTLVPNNDSESYKEVAYVDGDKFKYLMNGVCRILDHHRKGLRAKSIYQQLDPEKTEWLSSDIKCIKEMRMNKSGSAEAPIVID